MLSLLCPHSDPSVHSGQKLQRIVTQAKALEAQILKDLTNAFTVSAHLDEALMNTEAPMRREEMTHPSSSLLTVLET